MLPCKMTVDNILDDYVKMKLAKPNQSKLVAVTMLRKTTVKILLHVWFVRYCTFFSDNHETPRDTNRNLSAIQ